MTCLRLFVFVCFSLFLFNLNGQISTDQVYVDENGVMRWTADNSELHGFGVNYTLPFAHEYRMAKKTGISPEEAITSGCISYGAPGPGSVQGTCMGY